MISMNMTIMAMKAGSIQDDARSFEHELLIVLIAIGATISDI